LVLGTDYTVNWISGTITLVNVALSTDAITADYAFYAVPTNIKLATLMIAAKQLNLPKNSSEMKSSEGDSDYKVQYDLAGALGAIDSEIISLLARYKRKGVW
jgi:hypothetical protein